MLVTATSILGKTTASTLAGEPDETAFESHGVIWNAC
jgi:hypothetical protein